MDLGHITSKLLRDAYPDRDVGPPVSAFFKPADRMCPLKVGDVLYIGTPDEKPDQDLKFKFEVSLAEPQIAKPQAIEETLHELGTLVAGILQQFDVFFPKLAHIVTPFITETMT
jgi:hypothetical protein